MKISASTLSRLAAALLLFPNDAAAFFPTNLLTGNGWVGRSHTQITRDAIQGLYNEIFGIQSGQIPKAMTVVRDDIAKANADVDDDQTLGEKHFDGESFPEGQYRLITLKKQAVYLMSTGDVNGARSSLGQALHTLQDFYSHSNWAELKMKNGPVAPHPDLGMEGKFINRLPDNVDTCKDCGGGKTSLLKNLLSTIKLTTCANEKCQDNLITDQLTSGYYSGENRVKPSGSKKCSHGGPFDGSSGSSVLNRGQGINKDSATCTMSPHYKLHYIAAKLAQDGSRLFIRDMLKKFTDEQIRAFFAADAGVQVNRGADMAMDVPAPASVPASAPASVPASAPASVASAGGMPSAKNPQPSAEPSAVGVLSAPSEDLTKTASSGPKPLASSEDTRIFRDYFATGTDAVITFEQPTASGEPSATGTYNTAQATDYATESGQSTAYSGNDIMAQATDYASSSGESSATGTYSMAQAMDYTTESGEPSAINTDGMAQDIYSATASGEPTATVSFPSTVEMPTNTYYASATATLRPNNSNNNNNKAQSMSYSDGNQQTQPSGRPHWSFDGVACAPKGGRVYIDATTDDDHAGDDHVLHMAHLAAHNNIKVNAIVPAGRGGAQAYNDIAHRSGGHVFELYDDDDMNGMEQIGNAANSPETVDIMMVRDSVVGEKTYTVPIDSGMGNVTFVGSGIDKLTVVCPDGKSYCSSSGTTTKGQARIVSMKMNQMVNIDSPKEGNYKVTVHSSRKDVYTLTATGTSYLDLASFDFVQVGGRPGHTGYYPIKGAPFTSADTSSRDHHSVCAALMSGSYKSASFSFRSPSGEVLYPDVPLIPGSGKEGEQPANDFMSGFPASDILSTIPKDMMDELYSSNTSVPDAGKTPNSMTMPNIGQPFVVYVTGTDMKGHKYQRVVPKTYTPATILVKPLDVPSEIRHNRETKYTFKITNSGPADTVDVTAVDNHGLSSTVNPPSFKLSQGETKTVTVTVAAHSDAYAGTNTLVVAATKKEGGCKNYVVVNSPIRPENPVYEDPTYWEGRDADKTPEVVPPPTVDAPTVPNVEAPAGYSSPNEYAPSAPVESVVPANPTTGYSYNNASIPTEAVYQNSASRMTSFSLAAGIVVAVMFSLL